MRAFPLVALVVALVVPQLALAESPEGRGWHQMSAGGYCGTIAVAAPVGSDAQRGLPRAVSKVLYVNRCTGGCTITGSSVANAPENKSAVPGLTSGMVYNLPEFTNKAGETGAAADAEWNAIMACVRETESYFNIQVADTRPATGNYHMSVVGGFDENIGITSGGGQLLGISQLDCGGGLDNVISFTLAGEHRPFAATANDYIRDVCKTIVHEAGHAYGLEHEFRWLDDSTSACADPMSYDTETCDPSPAYFRNRIAACGEFAERPCQCPGSTNSHKILSELFGAGTPTVPPPVVAITTPNSAALTTLVAANAGSKRGVSRVELYLNGWKWGSLPGVAFSRGGGQPNPSPYAFQLPAAVPNGNYDIEVRAYDDLDVVGTGTATAVKGAPCADASTCNEGQKCEAGKCFWEQPSAAIGDACTYNEFCLSNLCAGTTDTQICTQSCIPGVSDSCPANSDLDCIETSPGKGICFPGGDGGGGCCQVNDSSDDRTWLHAGLSLGVLGLLVVRRKRRT